MKSLLNFSPASFQQTLLAWFDQHGRKDLPWQHNKSPYRIWISEIMLQQTQVKTVIPYFLQFMEHFPTLETLSEAPEDEVLHLWTGLGYYNRARNIHETARRIKQLNYFPDTLSELMELPGIGRSTAGAILAIAFEKPAAILDGNVKRVLTRLAAVKQWPGEKGTLNQLWNLAESLTPVNRVAEYTQAIMDLGATLCTRSNPRCTECPFEKICKARALGLEKHLPVAKPKKALPTKQATLLIFKHRQTILLEKRVRKGVWKNLWSPPEINKKLSLSQIKTYIQKNFSFSVKDFHCEEFFRHTFTHFHLDIFPVIINLRKKTDLKNNTTLWYDLLNPPKIGLPAPVKKIISELNRVE